MFPYERLVGTQSEASNRYEVGVGIWSEVLNVIIWVFWLLWIILWLG